MESDKTRGLTGVSIEPADDLIAWLREVNEEHFDYVVAITRRASNLIELLCKDLEMTAQDDARELKGFRRDVITDNALLVMVEDIADYYCEHRKFPQICCLDDVLAHGRNLNYFLESFKKSLFECLKEKDDTYNQEELEEHFYKCITIWIFAINDVPFFLRHEYQSRMRYQNMWTESRWRKLSDSIATYIHEGDIANTSYVLSAITEKRTSLPLANSNWLKDDTTQYRKCEQEFYLLKSACRYNVYSSVRCYKRKGHYYYTPYCFFERLSANQAVRGLRKFFEYLRPVAQEKSGELVGLFNELKKYFFRIYVYNQLFQLLLAHITLRIFLKDCISGNKDINVVYDDDKIARNFGPEEEIRELLRVLDNVEWTEEQLLEIIDALGLKDAGDVLVINDVGQELRHRIIASVERNVYVQALENEGRANILKSNVISDVEYSPKIGSNVSGEKPFEQFIDKVREEAEASVDNISVTASILSCITQMMDRGDVALKAKMDLDDEGRVYFFSALRNTELSLSIMPRRLGKYYSDFFRVSQFYWRDDDFPEQVRQYFEEGVFAGAYDIEAGRVVENAVEFAELICGHRAIIDSMLNWRSVYGN